MTISQERPPASRLARQHGRIGGPIDHARMPLLEAMRWYRDADFASFATPGHRMGIGAHPLLRELYGESGLAYDMPVSGGATDVHFQEDIWLEAERLGADAWGADRSYYLVNGSSAGNIAFFLAHLGPGDTVVIARDIHKSLLAALIQTGARPVYVAPRLHPTLNFGLGIHPVDVARTLAAHPEAKLVALVSPSYSGVSSDLKSIAWLCHVHDIPLYVDEAWGPHFHFHPDLPPSAMASGVDGAVTSTHKVLGAITQSAVLNIQGDRVNQPRLATAVGMAQTTSPAAYILGSIDACRSQMVLDGRALLDDVLELAADARTRLRRIPGIELIDGESLGVDGYDPTKLVIDVHGMGLTGFQVEEELRYRFAINPEASDLVSIICFLTIGDTREGIDRLVGALRTLSEDDRPSLEIDAELRSSGKALDPGFQSITPREAYFASSRAVPLSESSGQIAADLVIPYPPGIPVIAPGDIIAPSKIDYLQVAVASGVYISGSADPALQTIRIVDM